MFSKRHYEAIATVLQSQYRTREAHDSIVESFADMLARDNRAFNRNRFIAACEPGANVKARTRYKLPHGVTAVALDNPAELLNAVSGAIGEPSPVKRRRTKANNNPYRGGFETV